MDNVKRQRAVVNTTMGATSQFTRIVRASNAEDRLMPRIAAIALLATLLAACSASSRVDELLPARANTPARPAMQSAAQKNPPAARATVNAEPRTQPAAAPQHEANKVTAQNAAEE